MNKLSFIKLKISRLLGVIDANGLLLLTLVILIGGYLVFKQWLVGTMAMIVGFVVVVLGVLGLLWVVKMILKTNKGGK